MRSADELYITGRHVMKTRVILQPAHFVVINADDAGIGRSSLSEIDLPIGTDGHLVVVMIAVAGESGNQVADIPAIFQNGNLASVRNEHLIVMPKQVIHRPSDGFSLNDRLHLAIQRDSQDSRLGRGVAVRVARLGYVHQTVIIKFDTCWVGQTAHDDFGPKAFRNLHSRSVGRGHAVSQHQFVGILAGGGLSAAGLDLLNQRFHLDDLALLASDDLIGQLSDARIGDLGALARQNRDRMMGNHRPHIGDVIDGLLAAHQPERHCKEDDTADVDRGVNLPVRVHPPHERQHHHSHRRSHDQVHVESRFAEEHMVKLERVQVHQAIHQEG